MMFRYRDVKSFIGIVTQPEGLQVSILESNKNKNKKSHMLHGMAHFTYHMRRKDRSNWKNICMEVPLL